MDWPLGRPSVEDQGHREVRTLSLWCRWFFSCCFFCYFFVSCCLGLWDLAFSLSLTFAMVFSFGVVLLSAWFFWVVLFVAHLPLRVVLLWVVLVWCCLSTRSFSIWGAASFLPLPTACCFSHHLLLIGGAHLIPLPCVGVGGAVLLFSFPWVVKTFVCPPTHVVQGCHDLRIL